MALYIHFLIFIPPFSSRECLNPKRNPKWTQQSKKRMPWISQQPTLLSAMASESIPSQQQTLSIP